MSQKEDVKKGGHTRWISVDFFGLPEYLWPVIFIQSSWISFLVRTKWSFGSFNGGGAGSSLARRCATRLERLVAPLAQVVGTIAVSASIGSVPRFLQIDTQRCDLMSTPFMFHYEDSQQSPFHSLCQGETAEQATYMQNPVQHPSSNWKFHYLFTAPSKCKKVA